MRTISLADEQVPVLGQGTWNMGDSPATREAEVAALRTGIDLGMTLIDTAEMYGSGRSEQLVGEAIRGRRDEVFLVSKVLPSNASRAGTVRSCEESLRRLGTEWLDLYLLHWKGSHPLTETFAAFEELRQQGKIRAWGVSNFDRQAMMRLPAPRTYTQPNDVAQSGPATNQVLFNLQRRWPEAGLLSDLQERGIPLMAYSPIEQGVLANGGDHASALAAVAQRHGATRAQVALAWVISRPGVLAIPKASSEWHVRENAAADIALTEADLVELDAAFPEPTGNAGIEMI